MADLSKLRIGCAMTGSFCTFKQVFKAWENLKSLGADLTPVMSFNAHDLDTRFYPAAEAISIFSGICGKDILHDIPSVEPIGPKKLLDLLVIAPCTGNTAAKLWSGIVDTPVLMAAKAHMRGGKPLVIAISTNDALGTNFKNIGALMNMKNVYFVPFAQDNHKSKPNSVVADLTLLPDTIEAAMKGKQLQPVLIR